MKIKNPYLLFDFDGTIADSLHLGLEIVNQLSTQYGYQPITLAELEELRGQPLTAAFKRVRIPIYLLPKYLFQLKSMLTNELSRLKPITGICEVLRELRLNGLEMALLTSNSRDNVIPFLHKYNINIFNWYSFDAGLFKKTYVLHKEITKHKLDKNRIIYIGDEVRDIKAAKASLIPIISVSWGFQPKSILQSYQPDFLVNSPQELLELLILS